MVESLIFALQFVVASSLFAQTQPSAQTSPDSTILKNRLEQFFAHVRAHEYEQAASYLMYRGKDTARFGHDKLHYDIASDRKEVDHVCSRVSSMLTRAGTFEYQIYMYDKETKWYVWNLAYDLNGNRPSVAFAFKKIGGEFYLGDIDE